jgi:putative transcriptional regulator
LAELKKRGYPSNRLIREKILASATVQQIRDGKVVGNIALNTLCTLLQKQPGSIIKWIPDPEEES